MCDPVQEAENAWETATQIFTGAINWVVDEVLDPVVTTTGKVIEGALNDPVATIAKVAAIATQQYWALPLIEGASVGAKGGDLSDVFEATAKAYVMQELGSYAGETLAGAPVASEYGTSIGSQQTAMLAAQEAGLGTSAAVAGSILGGAGGSAVVATVAGKDPLEALIVGGAGAATPALLGQVTGFNELSNSVQRVVSAAVSAKLTNQNPTAALISSTLAAADFATKLINEFDPTKDANGKTIPPDKRALDDTQRAIITDVLMGTALAAFTGGPADKVIGGALMKAGSKALGEVVTNTFKTDTAKATKTFTDTRANVEAIEKNETEQKTVVGRYNAILQTLAARQTTLNDLLDTRTTAYNTHTANPTQATFDAVQAATAAYNNAVLTLNSDYTTTFKPALELYGGQLDTLKGTHTLLTEQNAALMKDVTGATNLIRDKLDPLFSATAESMVEVLRPDFDPVAYKSINGLGEDDNAYEHFLREGQFKGLPVNQANAEALATQSAKSAAVTTKTAATVKPEDIFDGTNYASLDAAKQAAASMGRSHFTGPDGKTYKILTEAETRGQIRSATSFGEAFSTARRTLGTGATFEWTDPETGQTKSYTTQTREEAAKVSNAGSLITTDYFTPPQDNSKAEVAGYVNRRILDRIADENLNPADLTKTEYSAFINAYLNGTDAQRQKMLGSADAQTFRVIQTVLDEAPAAVKELDKLPKDPVANYGNIKGSDYTNYLQVIKTGFNTARDDIRGVAVRGMQLVGDAIGANTTALSEIQDLITKRKDDDMSKLVGYEKAFAGGIASAIQSSAAWMLGGKFASISTMGAVAANNAWIEGANSVIDNRGNVYPSAEEARKFGVFEGDYRKLTASENAYRTAMMTAIEVAGEAVGVPGLSKLMKGVPLNQGIDGVIAGIKRMGVGVVQEEVSELATTAAQLAFDNFSSAGLAPNAKVDDYLRALAETAVATLVATGTSGSIGTVRQNLYTAHQAIVDRESTVTPLKYDTVVAENSRGERVTLGQLLTAQAVVNVDDPQSVAEFADLKPVVNLNSTIDLGTSTLRLADVLGGAMQQASASSMLSGSAVAEIMRQNNFVPDDNAVAKFAGKLASSVTFKDINTYINDNRVDANEVRAIAKQEGITLNDNQVQQYVKQGNDAVIKAELTKTFDPMATTFEEAQAYYKSLGYTPTDAEVRQLFGARPTSADVTAAQRAAGNPALYNAKYDWDGDGRVDSGDVLNILKAAQGRAADPAAPNSPWTMVIPESVVQQRISEYVAPRYVTFAEAKKYLTDAGYTPTDAEVQQFVGQYNEQQQQAAVLAYVDPRKVDAAEVRAAYAALGLEQPTEADVQKLVGQYAESELAGRAQANLDPARFNTINAQIANLASQEDVATAISNIKFPPGISKADVTAAITDYMTKNPGLSLEQVAAKITEATSGLATPKSVTDAISTAIKGYATKADIDAAIADIKFPAGISKDDVSTIVKQAFTDNPGLTKADVQAVVDAALKTLPAAPTVADITKIVTDTTKNFATQKDISDAIANIKFPEGLKPADVTKAITDYMTANPGLTIQQVAERIGEATKNLATTSGVQTSIADALKGYATAKDVEASQKVVLDRMSEYEKAGISRDQALTKAIQDAATTLGKSQEEIAKQIGTPETVDAEGKKVAATGIYAELGGVESRLTKAISDAQAAGLKGDAALQSAIDTVASNLGTTRTDLLTQLGKSEAALKTQFATQLGTTETALKTQIGAVSTDLQTKYDALTAGQKALADQLTQQGIDLDTAITTAARQTQAQITDLQTTLGRPTQAATQRDLDAVITLLQQQGAYDPRYDYNGDRVIDDKDKTAIEQYVQAQQPGYTGTPQPFTPAAGSMWAPTGLFGEIASGQTALQKQIADEAAATRAANQASALRTQRMGNLNTMMQMLGQAPDVAGQQVTVKAPDPLKLGYVYDWGSIFANPQQEKMFVTPYAKGGPVRDPLAVNDELLKILRG